MRVSNIFIKMNNSTKYQIITSTHADTTITSADAIITRADGKFKSADG